MEVLTSQLYRAMVDPQGWIAIVGEEIEGDSWRSDDRTYCQRFYAMLGRVVVVVWQPLRQ